MQTPVSSPEIESLLTEQIRLIIPNAKIHINWDAHGIRVLIFDPRLAIKFGFDMRANELLKEVHQHAIAYIMYELKQAYEEQKKSRLKKVEI